MVYNQRTQKASIHFRIEAVCMFIALERKDYESLALERECVCI